VKVQAVRGLALVLGVMVEVEGQKETIQAHISGEMAVFMVAAEDRRFQMAQEAQSVLFGQAIHVRSLQQIRVIYNGTLHSH
jgi:hypothetical protein